MSTWGVVMWIGWWSVCVVGTFVLFEWMGWRSKNTLSRFMWTVGQWRPSIFIFGMMIGGLVVHFWWQWCPDGSGSLGVISR